MREEGLAPVIFYANSNIHPAEEYAHRLETLRAWAEGEAVEVVEGAYDAEAWEATAGRIGEAALARAGETAPRRGVSPSQAPSARSAAQVSEDETPLRGAVSPEASREARCRACYRLRFEEAARYAREHGFDTLGTTLSVSPYQYTEIIREELERAAAAEGIAAHFEDYRPFYDEATRRSREGGMYRQNYCGCRFSDAEAAAERSERKAARRAAREAEAAAHAEERAAAEAERARNRAEKQAYANKQARKRAILRAMRERRNGDAHDQ